MRLLLYRYRCGNCGFAFKTPDLGDMSYGDFLLRSDNNDMVYLKALKSKEFSEVSSIIGSLPEYNSKAKQERSKILHKVFGFACDDAPDGTKYQITNFPLCPQCKSHKMASWGPTFPEEFVDLDLPSPTYFHWDGLNPEEKKQLIRSSLKSIGEL